MLGLANVCELAEINKNVWMDILGGRMGNKPGKNTLNFIAEQKKNIYSDPWVWALLSLECNYAHLI